MQVDQHLQRSQRYCAALTELMLKVSGADYGHGGDVNQSNSPAERFAPDP
jgi:hypothetical protein